MSLQPPFMAPPSYSRTNALPPPYKAPISAPTSNSTSFNPIKSITRVFKNFSITTSTVSVPLSITKNTTTSPIIEPASPTDRTQPSLSLPPPAYSPIKSAPTPFISPPAYSASPEPRLERGINPRSNTRGQVTPRQSHVLAFNDEAGDWEALRQMEERRQWEELELAQREEQGCCAWWWGAGANSLPWASFYIF